MAEIEPLSRLLAKRKASLPPELKVSRVLVFPREVTTRMNEFWLLDLKKRRLSPMVRLNDSPKK